MRPKRFSKILSVYVTNICPTQYPTKLFILISSQIHNQEHPSALSYEEHLTAALEFENPNYDVLFQLNGLQPNENLTLINKLRFGFPEADYAPELRQKQASQWAFR